MIRRQFARRRTASLCLAALAGAVLLGVVGSARSASAQTDDPAARWAHFLEQRSSPGVTGLGARLQTARLEVLQRPPLFQAGPLSAVTGGVWEPLGPRPIEGWEIAGWLPTASGRVSAVTLHPENLNVIFAGGAQGGVWRTDDGGVSWQPLTDSQCSLAMGAIVVDPVDPEIIYAGTGEQHFSGDSYYGCGVLRSSDGGQTWTQLGAASFTRPEDGGTRIARMAVDPETAGSAAGTVVYAATSWGFFRSGDSGNSWTRTLAGLATDLVVHADAPDALFAAVYGSGVYRSSDKGVTWEQLPVGLEADSASGNPGRINLAQAHSDPSVVFAGVHNRGAGDFFGLYRTTDGGAAWSRRDATGAGCRRQCWYDMALAVHPQNPEVVYFGGVELYRSVTGGASFQSIGNRIHVDQHIITTDPRRPDMILVGNDGGVYRSMNRGDGWESLNEDLELTQFYEGVSVDPHGPWGVLGGTQDNGTLRATVGEQSWRLIFGGDGGYTAINPFRDEFWIETQWGGSYSGPRRADGRGDPVQRINGIRLAERALFIPPLVMDPFDPSVLYFGTIRLYRTGNRGEYWEVLNDNFDMPLNAIAPSRSDPDVVYVGTRGAVYATTDGGESWTSGGPLPDRRWVTDLAVHPRDPSRAWATVSGFGTGHVFATRDFGASWRDITGDLPDHPVNAIVLDPGDPEQLFVGTDLTVFASDGNGSWRRFGEELPMVAVFDLTAEPNAGVLVAATHGRGAFSLPLRADLSVATRPRESLLELSAAGAPEAGAAVARIYGTGWPDAEWTAASGGAPWLSVDTESGGSFDSLRWTVDPKEAPGPGIYEDTIVLRVDGAAANRAEFVVRLDAIDVAAVELGKRAGGTAATIAGVSEWFTDTVAVGLRGPNAAEASWTTTYEGPDWLQLLESTGGDDDLLVWRRGAGGLSAGGTRAAELVIRVDGSSAPPVVLADTLVVAGDVSVERAFSLLASGPLAGSLPRRVLDRLGNQDGEYNLGDFLAWIDRCERGEAVCGEGGAPVPDERSRPARPAEGNGGGRGP